MTQAPTKRQFTPQVEQWRSLVAQYFPPDQIDNALAIMQRESGGDPKIASKYNARGTENSWGLFQINLRAHPLNEAQATDPAQNVAYAAKLFKDQGWSPWRISAGNEGLLNTPRPASPAGPTPPTPQPSGPTPDFQKWLKSTIDVQRGIAIADRARLEAQNKYVSDLRKSQEGDSQLLGLKKNTPDDKIKSMVKSNLEQQGLKQDMLWGSKQQRADYLKAATDEFIRLKSAEGAIWQSTIDNQLDMTRQYLQSSFLANTYASLGAGIIGGSIKSFADIEAAFKSYTEEHGWKYNGLDSTTTDNLKQIYDQYAKFVQPVPGATPEQVRQQTQYLAQNPPSRRVAIGSLSTEAIRSSLMTLGVPKLPPGLTEQDLRNTYSTPNMSDPEVQKMVNDARGSWQDFVAKSMSDKQMLDDLKSGLVAPDLNKKLSLGQHLTNLLATPWTGLVTPAIKLFDEAWHAPAVAVGLYGFDTVLEPDRRLAQTIGLEIPHLVPQQVRDAINHSDYPGLIHGGSILDIPSHIRQSWSASGQAWEDYRKESPAWKTIPADLLLDPTSYFGFGIFPKAIKSSLLGLGASENVALRAFTASKFIEDAWNTVWNIPLTGALKVVKAPIYTIGQLADHSGRDVMTSVMAMLNHEGGIYGTSVGKIRELVHAASQAYREDPTQSPTLASETGRRIIKGYTRVISTPEVTGWGERIKSKVSQDTPNLNSNAEKLLSNIEQGGLPSFTKPTDYMFQVLRENGIAVTPNMTVDEVVTALKGKAGQGYQIWLHGTDTLASPGVAGPEGLRVGSGLTQDLEQAQKYAETQSRISRAQGREADPIVLQFRVKKSDLEEIPNYFAGGGSAFTAKEALHLSHEGFDALGTFVPTQNQLASINHAIESTFATARDGFMSIEAVADHIIATTGWPRSAHDELVSILTERLDATATRIASAVSGNTAASAVQNLVTGAVDISHSNYASGLARTSSTQGLVAALTNQVDIYTKMFYLQKFNSYLVRPWATAFLKFLNFAPWNFLETGFRAGGLWRPGATAVDDLISHHGDLLSLPYEFHTPIIHAGSEYRINPVVSGSSNLIDPASFSRTIFNFIATPFKEEESFISRLQQLQRAKALDSQTMKHLTEIAPVPVKYAADLTNDITPTINSLQSLTPKARQSIRDDIFWAILKDPAAIARTKVPMNALDLRQAMTEFSTLLDHHPNLPEYIKVNLLQQLSTRQGARWADLNSVIDETWQLAQDSAVAQLSLGTERLKSFFIQFSEPQGQLTAEQVYTNISQMMHATQAVDDSIAAVRSTTTSHARDLRGAAKDHLHEASYNAIADYMKGVEENFAGIFQVARDHVVSSRLFSPAQRNTLLSLIENQRKSIQALIDVRTGESTIAADIIPRIRAGKATWADFYAARDPLWNHYNDVTNSLRRQYNALTVGEDVSGSIQPVQGALTSQHIAALFASNPNDLSAGLVDAMTIMPKGKWTATIKGRADGLAARLNQGTAEDLGFTDAAIGNVYDSLIRESGLDPANLPALAPIRAELEGLRQQTGIIRMSRGIHPDDYQRYTDAIDHISAQVANSPIHDPNYVAGYKSKLHLRLSGETGAFMVPPPEDIDPVAAEILGIGPKSLGRSSDEMVSVLEQALSGEPLGTAQVSLQDLQDEITATGKWESGSFSVTKTDTGYTTRYASTSERYDVVDYFSNLQDAYDRMAQYGGVGLRTEFKAVEAVSSTNVYADMSIDELRSSIEEDLKSVSAAQETLDTVELSEGARQTIQTNLIDTYDEMRISQAWLDSKTGKPSQLADALKNIVKNLASEEGRVTVQTFASINDYLHSLVYFDREPLNLRQAREHAMERARAWYESSFTDYTNANLIDSMGKAIFPFWSYESQRWPYLYRTFVQHPGLFNAMSVYNNNTDNGYIHIPYSDLAINPTRGTVLMGGMRGLIRKYPQYYDNPRSRIVGPALDAIGRFGFFPGLGVNLAAYAVGAQRQFDLPPILTTPVNSLVAAGIPGASALREIIYPSDFQNFNTVQLASKYSQEANADFSGADIWRKLQNKIPLTEQEQSIWDRATRWSSGYQGLFEQTGLFKLDVEARKKANIEAANLIQQLTGITPDQQDELQQNGLKLNDVVSLDPQSQRQLYDLNKYKYWTGLSDPLYPKGLQQVDLKRTQFWVEVAKIGEQARTQGFTSSNIASRTELEKQFQSGEISPTEYLDLLSKSKTEVASRIDGLKTSETFKGVPITLEERRTFYEKYGIPVPTDNPWVELSQMYYEITPKPGRDGNIDWNAYFATVDTLIDSMPEPYKAQFLDFIHNNWTNTEKLYWQVNKDFIRPYNNAHQAVLVTFSPDEQSTIQRYESASAADQATIRETVLDIAGNSLINTFNTKLRTVRDNLRRLSPEMDAWLYFWDKTNKPLTPAAESIYNRLMDKYQSAP